MKKRVMVYFYLGALIVASVLALYLFNLPLTGFAVFSQNSQAEFDEGNYQNVFYNTSLNSIVLSQNQTSGTYTSKIFDANESVVWNNLTWQGQGNLSFEVRACSSADCSDSNFTSANLNNINLSSRYFQYKTIFSISSDPNITTSLQSVSIGSSSIPVVLTSVLISEPSGTKTSRTEIPLQFTATGNNLQCWYEVKKADGEEIIANTTLSGCGNSTFSVNGDGDYVVTVYANGSSGFASQSSTFLVSVPAGTSSQESEEEPEEPVPEETLPEEIPQTQEPQVQQVTELSLQNIESFTANPNDFKNLNLVAQNTGNTPISACRLSASGEFASWLTIPDESKNLNAGEQKTFAFSISVPETADGGIHGFSLSVQCAEITRSSDFSVDVIKKSVSFSLLEVERPRADTVRVTYSLTELLNKSQAVEMKFLFYNAGNQEVANESVIQNLSAGESNEFLADISINESLEGNLTLEVNLNSERYSSSVKEPIVLGAPTGFFILGDELGTTGNIAAIIILVLLVLGIFFYFKRKSSKN